jgi:hypothetical protein
LRQYPLQATSCDKGENNHRCGGANAAHLKQNPVSRINRKASRAAQCVEKRDRIVTFTTA